MFKLSLKSSGPGVFSSERLVRFVDAKGQEQTALVDAGFVREESGGSWLEVRAQMQGGTALISLPNDGTRVRVQSGSVQPLLT